MSGEKEYIKKSIELRYSITKYGTGRWLELGLALGYILTPLSLYCSPPLYKAQRKIISESLLHHVTRVIKRVETKKNEKRI